MVQAGLVTPNEATWLGSLRHRKAAIAQATRYGGRPAGKAVKRFAAQVVELAFVRDRIDRGFGDPRAQALLVEEAYRVHAARAAAAPALHALAGYRAPADAMRGSVSPAGTAPDQELNLLFGGLVVHDDARRPSVGLT